MSAAALSATKAKTPSAERKPRSPANPLSEISPALNAVYALHRQAGNRALSHLIDGGVPLAPDLRAEMEARFGESFAAVRVHNDGEAQASAAALGAKAYTIGENIVFSADRFAPRGAEGKRLLAHELAHVVQQRRGGASPPLSSVAPHKSSAGQAAAQVAAGAPSVQVHGGTAVGVARELEDDKPKSRPPRKAGGPSKTGGPKTSSAKKPTVDTLKPDVAIKDPVQLRGKHTLQEFSGRAHDPDINAELAEERTRRRSRQSEEARHASRLDDIDEHHGFPKFLGGNRIQKYIKLTKDLHYLYHEELYYLLNPSLAPKIARIPTTYAEREPRGKVRCASAISAMMPPSPSLSARMMIVTYFSVTTIISAQNTSDSTPSTVTWSAVRP